MKIDLTTLTLEELSELKNQVQEMIDNYSDGFTYECHLSSYGRRSQFHYTNAQSTQDLCWEYNGDDGIITVYTNNPNLGIDNYGSVYYFSTMEEAKMWRNYIYMKNQIPHLEEKLDDWEKRMEVPFRDRPHFEPDMSKEDLKKHKNEVEELERTIVMPVLLNNYDED